MTGPGTAPDGDPAPPRKGELLDAFDGVVNRERERALERRSLPVARRTHAAMIVVCILSWGALAYTWLAQPEWLFPTDQSVALSPVEKESRLRFAMYLERERVLDYLSSHRRLPKTLAEAGDVEAGVEYAVSGESTFVVSAMVGDTLLTLNESQRADELLKPAGISPARPR